MFLIVDNSKLEKDGTYIFNNENYLSSSLSLMKGELTNHAVKKAYLVLSLRVNIFKNLKKYCFLNSSQKCISLRGLSVLVILKSASLSGKVIISRTKPDF